MRRAAVRRSTAAVEQAHKRRLVLESEAGSAAAKAREITLELDRKEKLLRRSAIAQSEVDEVQARVEGAQALLEAAQAEVEVQDAQIRDAEASLTMAEAERLHAEAVVKQRDAALDQAKVDLTRTDIRAPIDGVVIRRDVDIGQTVAASLQAPTLFTLAEDLRHIKVEVRVDEADIGQITPGQAVFFTVDAFPGRRFEGRVVQIRKAPDVFQNVVTYSVIVSAENPDLALLPGMTAVVRVQVAEARDALRIPNAALRFAPAQDDAARLAAEAVSDDVRPDELPNTVWTLGRDGRPRAVHVRIGASDSQFSTVDAGALAAGDAVITGRAPEAAD
jgi:HlyD family secretion protein